MQKSDSIYEIAKLMNNKNYIKNDIAQAMQLAADFFKNKYITSFENELEIQSKNIKNNPSKEMRFLSLMKEFMPEQTHNSIDNMINAMTTASAISSIRKKLEPNINFSDENTIKAASLDPSVKSDGVYDIDENCQIMAQTDSYLNFPVLLVIVFLLIILID